MCCIAELNACSDASQPSAWLIHDQYRGPACSARAPRPNLEAWSRCQTPSLNARPHADRLMVKLPSPGNLSFGRHVSWIDRQGRGSPQYPAFLHLRPAFDRLSSEPRCSSTQPCSSPSTSCCARSSLVATLEPTDAPAADISAQVAKAKRMAEMGLSGPSGCRAQRGRRSRPPLAQTHGALAPPPPRGG